MALQFNIRLTAAGLGTGPFDIYGNLDLVNPIANNVDKNDLILGYTVSAPNYTTFVRIQSDSFSCDNYIDIGISNTPCAIFETDSYTGNSYYAYPNYVIPNTKPKNMVFSWSSYDRPNRFGVYDSTGLQYSTGWRGFADYPGPWGSSLNTTTRGTENICFNSLTGRYVLVEAGPASPTTPESDTFDFSLDCSGVCPSPTPTSTVTPTVTLTATVTPTIPVTPTNTQTVSPTNTQTPTPTTPVICYYYDVTIGQTDLDNAVGNTGGIFNNTVYIDYIDCDGNSQTAYRAVAGTFIDDLCVLSTNSPNLYIYINNSQSAVSSSSSSSTLVQCNVPPITPTMTPTNTVTPSITLTNTITPTITSTPLPPFISTWRTTGFSETITLPYWSASTSYDGIIDWGDGTQVANSFSNRTHTYSNPGDYDVKIYGTISGWTFGQYAGNSVSNKKIISISQWGQLRLGRNSHSQFYDCGNLSLSGVTDVLNLTGNFFLFRTFMFCYNLTTIPRLNEWDVSSIVNMQETFRYTSFNDDVSSWNVSNNVTLSSTFSESQFNQDVSSWNVSKVTNMLRTFLYTPFNLDISSWNVSAVTTMHRTFYGTVFNQDISGWNVSNVRDMSEMFAGAQYFNRPIGSWNTSKVTNMNAMFQNAFAFNQNLSSWNVSGVTTFGNFMLGKTDSNFSSSNLDAIYNGWSSQNVKSGITISFGSIKFSENGLSGKQVLTGSPYNWVITDGGMIDVTPTPTPTVTATPTLTPSPTVSVTPSVTITSSITPTASVTPTVTPSMDVPTIYLHLCLPDVIPADGIIYACVYATSENNCTGATTPVLDYVNVISDVGGIVDGEFISLFSTGGCTILNPGGTCNCDCAYDVGPESSGITLSAITFGVATTGVTQANYVHTIDCYTPECIQCLVTPTPTITPTLTTTPTVTPTLTPTSTITPTLTPTPSITPTITPTFVPTSQSIQLSTPQNDNCVACRLTTYSQTRYVNPTDTTPNIGDVVYQDSTLNTVFNGNSQWFKTTWGSPTEYSIQIATNGQVLNVTNCSTCPTQTPSPTETPTPTPTTPEVSYTPTPTVTETPTSTITPTPSITPTITPTFVPTSQSIQLSTPQNDNCVACRLTTYSQTRYVNPTDTTPNTSDIVYQDSTLTTVFNGNSQWFKTTWGSPTEYSIQIATNGQVLNVTNCSTCPTQTPTPTVTLTQTPTTPEASYTPTPTVTETPTETPTPSPTMTPSVDPYFYYNATEYNCGLSGDGCSEPSTGSRVIQFSSAATSTWYSNGINAWIIIGSTSGPSFDILGDILTPGNNCTEACGF